MSDGESISDDQAQEPGPLTGDDTRHPGPEASGQAEAEGSERVTGEQLPDVTNPEETEPGKPAKVADPGASAVPQSASAERPARPERAAGERPQRPAKDAAPAAPEPPPPGSVYDIFRDVLPGVPLEGEMGKLDVLIKVRPAELPQVLERAKNHQRLNFDYLRCLTAVDHETDGVELVYHLYSFEHAHNVTLKSLLPNEALRVPTATSLWKAADWLERECWEMFGIEFAGHPDLRPLLLEEDTVDLHPLRKSHALEEIEIKQGSGIAGDEDAVDGE